MLQIPQCWANPPLLLDYRCYVKDGKIGKNWLPGVGKCLQKLNGMTAEDIMHSYGFPNLLTATALKNRSQGNTGPCIMLCLLMLDSGCLVFCSQLVVFPLDKCSYVRARV